MPAVSAPATVLVTGANGYIAIYIIQYLLARGFNVRGTVRSASKGDYVRGLIGDKFTYVIVPDVNAPGAFDEAVKGVDAIEHIGAPLPNKIEHSDEIIKPAVDGTIALLESARKAGTVKRVVITSTVFAQVNPVDGKTHFSEESWNDGAVDMLKQLGPQAPSILVYAASKVLIERAAFDYVKTHEGSINFDVVTLLPTYVFGPPLNDVNPDLEASFSSIAALLSGLTKPSKVPEWFSPDSYIDVRDVAEAHVRAALTEGVANQRFNLMAGEFSWGTAYKAVGLQYKNEPKEVEHPYTFAIDKVPKTFGIKYHTAEEMVKDTWDEFAKRGFVTAEGKANF